MNKVLLQLRPERGQNIIAYSSLKLLLFILQIYRYLISPWLGNHCRFYPSCSVYATEALTHFGVLQGLWMTLRRLSCCHPFHPGGYDPVVSHSHKQASQPSTLKTCHPSATAVTADCELANKNKET